MKVVFVEARAEDLAAPDRAAERVFHMFSRSIDSLDAGSTLAPELRARELLIDEPGGSRFSLKAPASGSYWLFTQHLPSEFDLRLVSAAGLGLHPKAEKRFAAGHRHDSRVASLSVESPRPVDPQRFETWIASVLKEQGTRLYRLKGFVNLRDRADRVVIQGVHMSLDASSLGPWGDQPRRTQLVFIGRDLDDRSLRAGFDSCLA
jgi:hypothetical protein